MKTMERERLAAEAKLAAMAKNAEPIELHPNAAEAYAGKIDRLQQLLDAAAEDEHKAPLVRAVRELVDRIVITPQSDERAAPVDIQLYGRLAAFMEPIPNPPTLESMGAVVAGGRIELPT